MTMNQQPQSEQTSFHARQSAHTPSTGYPRGTSYYQTPIVSSDRPAQYHHPHHVSSGSTAYDYQSHSAMNMGHMGAALLDGSSTTTPYGHTQYQASVPQYSRQPVSPYSTYLVHARVQAQSHSQTGQDGYQQTMTTNTAVPHYPTASQLYGHPGLAPYQMYAQPGTSFYRHSTTPMKHHQPAGQYQQKSSISGSYIVDDMRRNSKNSIDTFTPYQSDRPQYPIHVIQEAQGNTVSSTGGKTTYGTSVPETSADGNNPRGPPRKPKQSGHALWVGNLPPNATVSDLKDHFARGLTEDIESLKLISKSNCAFVNYKSQAACAMAMHRFHESRFHGTRLVCRLRRTSDGSPAGPSPASSGFDRPLSGGHGVLDGVAHSHSATPIKLHQGKVPARFFVLKSLTMQDLESSVRTGYWATQPHNEDALNQAFESADNVYLIFSANKSGEYFGYARMTSPITYDAPTEGLSQQQSHGSRQSPSRAADHALTPDTHESGNTLSTTESGPRAISTPATEWAPRGRIIDDLGRGTIFWEADPVDGSPPRTLHDVTPLMDGERTQAIEDERDFDAKLGLTPSHEASTTHGSESEQTTMALSGGNFGVEWLNTRRVPFFTTRGLRNPWNVNREVKIARDGTELEPGVAGKLIALFNNPNIRRMDVPYMH